MLQQRKKILLAFSSYSAKALLKEIFSQMERSILVEYAPFEGDVLKYLSRQTAKSPPGLILFDSPPVKKDIFHLLQKIRAQHKEVPVAILLPPADIPVVTGWVTAPDVFIYPLPTKPSETKFVLRDMMNRYVDSESARSPL